MNPETSSPLNTILLVGLNHHLTPVELREKLAIRPEGLPAALAHLQQDCQPQANEFVLLSTCNRTEIYACSDAPEQTERALSAYLAQKSGLPIELLVNYGYCWRGERAVQHLLRVAAGLDSLIIGEHEILGQVRQAFEAAMHASTSGIYLSALFRAALQTGKRVRSETEIGRDSLSIAAVVVELAQEQLGSLQSRTALLIGAGKISAMTARALTCAGLRCILVANRTYERAQKLATALGGQALHFEQMPQTLAQADIVICSTGAPHLVLHAPIVQTAMQTRPGRPLLVADLAVPRDADPEIAGLENVHLINIDGLEQQVQTRHPLAAATRQRAEQIVQDEMDCFITWLLARRSAGLICALTNRANSIVATQVQKTLRKLDNLTPEQEQVIANMGKAIASQLLHQPIQRLKAATHELDSADIEALVPRLFDLD